jgi:hypothetical protein
MPAGTAKAAMQLLWLLSQPSVLFFFFFLIKRSLKRASNKGGWCQILSELSHLNLLLWLKETGGQLCVC